MMLCIIWKKHPYGGNVEAHLAIYTEISKMSFSYRGIIVCGFVKIGAEAKFFSQDGKGVKIVAILGQDFPNWFLESRASVS